MDGRHAALLKVFLEQTFRPGFAIQPEEKVGLWKKLFKGRSARIAVTMGMPAPVYCWYYRAHSLRSLEHNILDPTGIGPVRSSLIGMVEGSARHRGRWLEKMEAMGREAR